MSYSTIVAGVADLDVDTTVLERACAEAKVHDATLLLVAGFDPVSARDRARTATEAAPELRFHETTLSEAEAYDVVERARDRASAAGVAVAQGVVVEGRAVPALTLVALEAQADLIVVGAQGTTTFAGRLFGATSVQVLRKSQCDVLVVAEPGAAA